MNTLKTLVFACLLVPLVVQAQSCWPSSYGPMQFGGTGSPVVSGKFSTYSWWSWRCPSGMVIAKVVADDWKGPGLGELLREAAAYPTMIDAAAAMWTKYDVGPYTPGFQAALAHAKQAARK